MHSHTVHLPRGALLIPCTNPCVAQVSEEGLLLPVTVCYCLLLSVTVCYCLLLCVAQVTEEGLVAEADELADGSEEDRTWCTTTPCTFH